MAVVVDSQEDVRWAPSPAMAMGGLRTAPAIPELTATVARGLRSKATPVEILRKSARGAEEAEVHALDRAVRLTAKKHASVAALPKGKNLDPLFSILQELPDSHLLSVASDCCIAFLPSAGNPAESLSMICAKEIAQAALAKARAVQEAAEAKANEVETTTQVIDTEGTQAKSPGGEALSKSWATTSTVAGAMVQVSVDDVGRSPRAAPTSSRRRAKSAVP